MGVVQEENSTTMDIVWTKNVLRTYVNPITGRHTRSNMTAKGDEKTMIYTSSSAYSSLAAGGSAPAPSGVTSEVPTTSSFASLPTGSSATLVSAPDSGMVSSGLAFVS